jgi:2-iminobutanoate/2-iminopropanoate deaminase
MVQPVPTPANPPLGPYSPAVRAGDWVVCAGQVGIDPATGEIPAEIGAQVRQALANVESVLAQSGCSWEHVAKTTLFVGSEGSQRAQEMNAIYEEVLGPHRPARTTVGVSWLPRGAQFEIEVWAHRPEEA